MVDNEVRAVGVDLVEGSSPKTSCVVVGGGRGLCAPKTDVTVPCWFNESVGLVRKWEGLSLKAYPDPATGGEPYTIGFGHTGADVDVDTVWTIEQCCFNLCRTVYRLSSFIDGVVTVPITCGMRAALISFSYNLGRSSLKRSTLLVELNSGDYVSAAEQFPRWVYAGGKKMRGLVRRRADEKRCFISDGVP